MATHATSPFAGASEDESGACTVLETMYRTERHSLLRFILRSRTAPDDASDVAQEAFLRLAQTDQSALRDIARPGAFLRQIARNLLRDRAKMAGRRSEHLHQPFDDEAISDANEIRRLEARDSLARIEAAMHRMKPKTREIFMAHRLDGLTYGEIAERTGMSVSGVEKQMAKAIAQIMRFADQ